MLIKDKFGIILNLHTSPISHTSFLTGNFCHFLQQCSNLRSLYYNISFYRLKKRLLVQNVNFKNWQNLRRKGNMLIVYLFPSSIIIFPFFLGWKNVYLFRMWIFKSAKRRITDTLSENAYKTSWIYSMFQMRTKVWFQNWPLYTLGERT